MTRNLGALPPKKDVRDYTLSRVAQEEEFPESFYCSFGTSNIKNQGSVSSCVAHATSSILEYYTDRAKLSTNFIYGIQNKECGQDGVGMYLRDACSIVSKYGDMLEEDCPGNDEVPDSWMVAEAAFCDKEKLDRAHNFRIDKYVSLRTEKDIKRFIMQYGPVLASIKWYDNFSLDKNNTLQGEQKGIYGYHAVAIIGWSKTGFICQNSWGKEWGNSGYFTLPFPISPAECFGLVDDDTIGDIKQPKRNAFLDVLYKIVNFILGIFNKK